MAGPWEEYQPKAEAKPWDSYKDKSYKSSILPFSSDASGKVSFDSNAGFLGVIKHLPATIMDAVKLPGDVLTGKVDPMSDEGKARAFELGSMVTPMNPMTRIGDRAIPGIAKNFVKQEVPTAAELKTASDAGYTAARNMGVDYSSGSIKKWAGDVQQELEQGHGVFSKNAPQTISTLQELQAPPAGSITTLAQLDALRSSLNDFAGRFKEPREQFAANKAIKRLDEFLTNPDPASVVAGPAAAAGEILRDARGNIAAKKRSDKITTTEESADLRTQTTNSARNGDNTLRQRLRPIVDPSQPKNARGFSAEELAAIEQAVRGTPLTNTARNVGNMMGGGLGPGGAFMGIAGASVGGQYGGALGGTLGATLPLIGAGLKAASEAGTRASVGKADEMIRMRSPLYRNRVANAPLDSEELRRMLMRSATAGLLGTSDPQGGGLLGP